MFPKYSQLVFCILLIFTFSCASSEYLFFDPNNEYNVNFYLSNQNPFKKEPVHIIVKLIYSSEGHEAHINVFDQDCSFGEGITAGHNLQSNKLILKEGVYKLIAEIYSNQCKLDVDFEIIRDQWIYIGYDENGQLKLKFSSRPFIFG